MIQLPDVPAQRDASPEMFQRLTRFMAGTRDALNEIRAKPDFAPVSAIMFAAGAGGWTNFGAPAADAGYWADALGHVFMRGLVVPGALWPATIFYLPEALRPRYQKEKAVTSNTATQLARILIAPSGAVQAVTGITFVSLDVDFWAGT